MSLQRPVEFHLIGTLVSEFANLDTSNNVNSNKSQNLIEL